MAKVIIRSRNSRTTTPIMQRDYARPVIGRSSWITDALLAVFIIGLVAAVGVFL